MSDPQAYQIIEDMLDKWDTLDKTEIREKLLVILPPICPGCKGRWGCVQKFGREIDPKAMYDAASTLYSLCPNCKYVHSYTY
jgi:hypothetical protein